MPLIPDATRRAKRLRVRTRRRHAARSPAAVLVQHRPRLFPGTLHRRHMPAYV